MSFLRSPVAMFQELPVLKAIRKGIWNTFNRFYEYHRPNVVADITGYKHPTMTRVLGHPLYGRVAELFQDTIGLTENIKTLSRAAQGDPLKRAYCNVAGECTNIFLDRADAQQLEAFNSHKSDRGTILKPLQRMLPHTLFLLPSNDEWKEKRGKLMAMAFSDKSLKELAGPMQEILDGYIKRLKANGSVPSLNDFLIEMSMNVVGQTLAGSHALSTEQVMNIADALDNVAKVELDSTYNTNIGMAEWLKWLTPEKLAEQGCWNKIRNKMGEKFAAILKYYYEQMMAPIDAEKVKLEEIFEEHLLKPNRHPDGSTSFKEKPGIFQEEFQRASNKMEEGSAELKLSPEQDRVREEAANTQAFKTSLDDMAVLIYSGHETTARLIHFCLLYLSENPEIMQKVRVEIDKYRPKNGAAWTRDDLKNMVYLDAILTETLRMQPTFPNIIRYVLEPIVIGNIPYCETRAEYDKAMAERNVDEDVILYPGENYNIVPGITQRLESLYDDPNTFKPERHLDDDAPYFSPRYGDKTQAANETKEEPAPLFRKENRDKNKAKHAEQKHKKGYMIPFGLGPRQCPGQRFAYQNGMLSMIHLLDNYDFKIKNAHLKDFFKEHEPSASPFETYNYISLKLKGDMGIEFVPKKVVPRLLAGCKTSHERAYDQMMGDTRKRKRM